MLPAAMRRISGSGLVLGSRRGAAAVEFAFVLPVILIIFMGIFEIAMLLYARSTLQFGVDKAARFAIVNQSSTLADLETKVAEEIGETMNTSGVTVAVTSETVSGVDFLVIQASKDYDFSLPFMEYIGTVAIGGHTRVPLTGQ